MNWTADVVANRIEWKARQGPDRLNSLTSVFFLSCIAARLRSQSGDTAVESLELDFPFDDARIEAVSEELGVPVTRAPVSAIVLDAQAWA